MLKKITAPAAGADDAELHRVVGASCLQHAGRALYRWDGGRHRGHRSCGLHEIAAGDILILRHDEHLILLFSPHFSMHVLVTELLVARIVQWMLRPAAVALWLGTLIVPLHTQPVPPPPSPVQIKDLQIPKLTTTRTGTGSTTSTSSTAPRASIRTWDTFRASTCARLSSSTCAASILIKSKRVLVFAPYINLLGNLDHHGVQQDWRVNPAFNIQMPRGTFGGAGLTDIFERFQNINCRRHDASVFLRTEYFKPPPSISPTPANRTFYVGYTDRLENLALANGTVLPIGFPSPTTARQFFAKVSYMFRF